MRGGAGAEAAPPSTAGAGPVRSPNSLHVEAVFENTPVGAFEIPEHRATGDAVQSVATFTAATRCGRTPLLHGPAVVQSVARYRHQPDDYATLDLHVEVGTSSASTPCVVLVPVGPFDGPSAPSIPLLRHFLSLFLGGVPVAVSEQVPLVRVAQHSREGLVGQVQLFADDIIQYIQRQCRRPSALCYAAGAHVVLCGFAF